MAIILYCFHTLEVVVDPTLQRLFLSIVADGSPLHLASRLPTSTEDVHKSASCVLILVQLYKWVVCRSVLHMGIVIIIMFFMLLGFEFMFVV